jgi:hypothetical protein
MSEETKPSNEADPTGSVRVDAWVGPLVTGPYLFEFTDFDDWCDHARARFKRSGHDSTSTICLDRQGRTCYRGKDFMQARDESTFPVRVFSLWR